MPTKRKYFVHKKLYKRIEIQSKSQVGGRNCWVAKGAYCSFTVSGISSQNLHDGKQPSVSLMPGK